MADQVITTGIDNLVNYLKEHGETEATELASKLGVEEGNVESWVGILEKADVVKVAYKVGKMYVSLSGGSGEISESAKKTAEMKKVTLEEDIKAQEESIKELDAAIESYKKTAVITESEFKSKAGAIKEMLDKLSAYETAAEKTDAKLVGIKKTEEDMLQKVSPELEEIEKRAEQIEGYGPLVDAKSRMNDLQAMLSDAHERLTVLNRMFYEQQKEQKETFDEIVRNIRNEETALSRELSEQSRKVEDYDRISKEYKANAENTKKELLKYRASMLDTVSKTVQETRQMYDAAKGQIAALKAAIENVRGELGGYAELDSRIREMRSSIQAVQQERDEIAKELGEIKSILKSASVISADRLPEKSVALEAAANKAASSRNAISKLGKDIKGIKKPKGK